MSVTDFEDRPAVSVFVSPRQPETESELRRPRRRAANPAAARRVTLRMAASKHFTGSQAEQERIGGDGSAFDPCHFFTSVRSIARRETQNEIFTAARKRRGS